MRGFHRENCGDSDVPKIDRRIDEKIDGRIDKNMTEESTEESTEEWRKKSTEESTEESTENEKLTIVRSLGPTLTRSEEIKIKAIARATKLMSKKMCLEDDGKLRRTTRNGVKVEFDHGSDSVG